MTTTALEKLFCVHHSVLRLFFFIWPNLILYGYEAVSIQIVCKFSFRSYLLTISQCCNKKVSKRSHAVIKRHIKFDVTSLLWETFQHSLAHSPMAKRYKQNKDGTTTILFASENVEENHDEGEFWVGRVDSTNYYFTFVVALLNHFPCSIASSHVSISS